MNITYSDFGNLFNARLNNPQCTTNINQLANDILSALQSAVDTSNSLPPPKNNGNGMAPSFYSFQTQNPETVLTYVPESGPYPSGAINLYMSSPDNNTDFVFTLNVEFFDLYRVTVTVKDVPAVTARFDISNMDQSTLQLFVYSFLGTAVPKLLDKVSNAMWNNVSAIQLD